MRSASWLKNSAIILSAPLFISSAPTNLGTKRVRVQVSADASARCSTLAWLRFREPYDHCKNSRTATPSQTCAVANHENKRSLGYGRSHPLNTHGVSAAHSNSPTD